MQNRRERRKLEKQFGLMKQYKNGSSKQRAEIQARRREMGKQLHNQHLERVENAQREAEEKRITKIAEGLMSKGLTEQEAVDVIDHNERVKEEREESLAKRKNRQEKKRLNK